MGKSRRVRASSAASEAFRTAFNEFDGWQVLFRSVYMFSARAAILI